MPVEIPVLGNHAWNKMVEERRKEKVRREFLELLYRVFDETALFENTGPTDEEILHAVDVLPEEDGERLFALYTIEGVC